MAQYRIRYKILPAGTGPDDYESADLDGGELVAELSDPEPTSLIIGGEPLRYGPHDHEVRQAVITAAGLKDGDEPIILGCDLV